ncbi:MAG: hypothetical protein PUF00_05930 [Paraprevotella sp.]|nr:hypothetical protein [Paraprevotella sp.]
MIDKEEFVTQDCSENPSEAKVSTDSLRGIHIVETGTPSVSGIENIVSCETDSRPSASVLPTSDDPSSWCYLYIHNMRAHTFEKDIELINSRLTDPRQRHACFIHRSFRYKPKTDRGGVRKEYKPTVSGLVFLQGTVRDLIQFLRNYFPQYHLVNDRSKHSPACIPNSIMQPFMQVVSTHPEKVTFLREPFERFAKDHVRLRILTGLFKGCEGYIIRIDRDRQLVFNFGGIAVAIRGVHKEDFKVVNDE